MSFYSYKNANADCCPGICSGNICQGLGEKICVQVKNVYDACLQQEQLDEEILEIRDIIPVVPEGCGFSQPSSCNCSCEGTSCTCNCRGCGDQPTYEEALANAKAQGCGCPPQVPCGHLTFDSCRSSTTVGCITDLSIDRMCDRPQFARVKANVHIPIDVLFHDSNCQEWIGRGCITVEKDVLLCIPDESIVPFTIESMASAICVSGKHLHENRFEITICVTVVLKVLAEVDLMIPSYGFCVIPPCEKFAENVCDEFFSLPLFPQQGCLSRESTCAANCACGCNRGTSCPACGMMCGSNSSMCPRCGRTMC